MNTTKRKLAVIAAVILLGAVVATAWQLASVRNQNKTPSTSKTQSTSDPTKPPEAPPSPISTGEQPKTACDLLDEDTAKEIIGTDTITKNDRVTAISNINFSSTTCEYAGKDKKVNIILYVYSSEEKAVSNKNKAQNQEIVVAPDGKTSSAQTRQSAVAVKGKHVVSASVMAGSSFDAESSEKLLKEALGKL